MRGVGMRGREKGGGEKVSEASDVQIYVYRLSEFWGCGNGLGGDVFLDVMKFGGETICNTLMGGRRSMLRLWRSLKGLDWSSLNARFYIVYSSTSLEIPELNVAARPSTLPTPLPMLGSKRVSVQSWLEY